MTTTASPAESTGAVGAAATTTQHMSPGGNPMGFGRMLRKEDARFLRGQGNYLDDITMPGMLYSAILR
ncbi:MAG TPA: hypothetical protein VFX52_08040, partial [Nocardioidaceae bacterium]|nr:hypothetical protein [Nocardioidaceae bacterium]